MSTSFVHLRVHSEYSLVDGLIRIDELVDSVMVGHMPAVALTDQSNLFATVKFYQAAMKVGIKPIIGIDIWLANDQDAKFPFHLTLLAQNDKGYRNITRLISRAYIIGQNEYGVPIIPIDWFNDSNEGIIVLSGACEGDVGHALIANNIVLAKQLAHMWNQLFPDRYYIELQRTGRQNEEAYIQAAVDLAHECELPVVATNDVRFISAADFEAHEARVCIHTGHVLEDAKRPRVYSEQQYLRNSEEMSKLFSDIPEALENSVLIAMRCNVGLTLHKNFLPKFPLPVATTTEEFLIQKAKTGLEKRLSILFNHQHPEFQEQRKPYDERLQLELDVINSMGFAGYFLIVADFIQWAKEQGIPVGPGRGSGVGSLVAYAIQITDLDPLQYELLFERFLNPERVSMPDFDIDFCVFGRDRVIEYVANTYGRESVSQIITYGTMAAKAVVRDVGRVLAYPYNFVDKIAKLIPFELGMTLEKALDQEQDLRQRYEQEDDVRNLIDLALKLEGITRNAGKHAGGVVIAPSNLTDYVPLYCEPNGENRITQFDKDDVEAVGLVKFDFLGLRTLTIIDWAVQIINAKRKLNNEPLLDVSLLPMDDQATFDLLCACSTTAIFQLESRGMKDLIKRLQPDCFEEIIALVALFRPGPLQSGMVDDFINCKHGRAAVEYPHPILEPILRPTYGIILYQEQAMQIAQVLSGYTLGAADLLRRAMGKKKPEEMAKQRAIFTEGAKQRGVDEQIATHIFDLIEKFAGYGFNKAHAAAYALVSYQTAWLKTHYPAEFMAAVLSSDMDHTDKVVSFIEECKTMGLKILPPNINQSHYKFSVSEAGEILYGLGAIKGVGEAAIENIIQNKNQSGAYQDLFDFCQRIDLRKANRRVLEALIRSGALDELGPHRAAMMATLNIAIQAAEQHADDQAGGQHDLFAMDTAAKTRSHQFTFVKVSDWKTQERLLGEKETLGHYISGHPIQRYEKELTQFVTSRIVDLKPTKSQTVVVAGLIVAVRIMFTKRGDKMAFVTLDDKTGRVEIAVFADVYENYHQHLVKDQLIVVQGEVSVDEFTGGYRLSSKRIFSMNEARTQFAKRLSIKIDNTDLQSQFFDYFAEVLGPYRQGECPVCIKYKRDNAIAEMVLGNEWRVRLEDSLLDSLKEQLGEEAVLVQY